MPHLAGAGTALNVAAIVMGSLLGMAVGHRFPGRVRSVVTVALGLVTLLIGAQSAMEVSSPALATALGRGVPTLVVLGALLIGGIAGALLRIEERLGGLAGRLQAAVGNRLGDGGDSRDGEARERFIEGWLSATLLFCVGPMAVLGALQDGLGQGISLLALKSVLDGFAALAFASSFGVGVLLSAASVAVVQGLLTVLGVLLGSLLPEAHLAALTATGGLLLVGIGLRLTEIKQVPVADLLPSLVVAPVLVQVLLLLR